LVLEASCLGALLNE